ncbi:MAG: hypothetical protein PHY64_04670 [Eubacteriales bacterium]|nr:hypothetical protein [Eubacteriales bacterium]
MDRQQLLAQISQAFARLGIAFTQEKASDLEIHTEFVNAGWSLGKKKFRYDAFIRLDENEKTAYLWQKTTESSAGVSLGGGFETATQSGGTIFRKVKIVQYGPEGKVVDLTLNLGEIAKAVKNTAKENGWKFRTALRQEKAKYPR